jgi:hypothetical protein
MKGCSGKAGFHPTIKTVGFQSEITVMGYFFAAYLKKAGFFDFSQKNK